MTVSYKSTHNSEEPEPQRTGVQQSQNPVAGSQEESEANLQRLPSSIRRKVVGRPPGNPPGELAGDVKPGNNFESKRNNDQFRTVPPVALKSEAGPSRRFAPFIQSTLPAREREIQPAEANGANNNPNEQSAIADRATTIQTSIKRD